jgi:CRISPR/Cas system-associated exonuclease Cas4 (RecB family)
LRGSIDLVERHTTGVLRATDYKTGKKRTEEGLVVGGGEVLQPVLYALVLEKVFGERVGSGRLHYCTRRGDFGEVSVELDDAARGAAAQVARNVAAAVREPFLPAAPRERACDWCDYVVICGTQEARRVRRKPKAEIEPLLAVRELP